MTTYHAATVAYQSINLIVPLPETEAMPPFWVSSAVSTASTSSDIECRAQPTSATPDRERPRVQPRQRRRRQHRSVVALGAPLWPELDQAEWRALPRAERRRRLRAALNPTESELETLILAGLEALGRQQALIWLRERMEAEADALCGAPKGRHRGDRQGRRHGYEFGSVVLGGRRVRLLRPRVRSLDRQGEFALPSYAYAQDEQFLSRAMLTQTLAGAAQRRYAPTVAGAHVDPPAGSISRSTVSRRCQEQMSELLRQVCQRPLGETAYAAVFLDGVHMGEHCTIAALGVTDAGEKQVLGLWEGATENEVVCRAAVEDLAARGLSAERGLLVVIDGGKGLHAAVRAVWGERALIQRCQCHKIRNLESHLPAHRKEAVKASMHRAWAQRDATRSERLLRDLAAELEQEGRAEAAASLREGLKETVTCIRLGLAPDLCTSLETTNAIESVFSRHADLTHRVKRWRDGRQARRWLATSMALAEQSFGRLPGSEHLPQLRAALARHVATLPPLDAIA